MTETLTNPLTEPRLPGSTGADFSARSRVDGRFHVVELSGELDIVWRADAIRACTPPAHMNVLVDLSGLTFLDCAGYGALVTVSTTLARRGGSLTIVNPTGEPRRLLTLIDELGVGSRMPVRYGRPLAWPAERVAS